MQSFDIRNGDTGAVSRAAAAGFNGTFEIVAPEEAGEWSAGKGDPFGRGYRLPLSKAHGNNRRTTTDTDFSKLPQTCPWVPLES
jgi:hypothetical protein